jgi:hypothetical protein
MTLQPNSSRQKERLLQYTVTDPDTGCWLWRGQVSNSGYGRIMLPGPQGRRMESAHRASYQTLVGAIPEGAFVRQTCGNRLCVNPEHLELQFETQGAPASD